MKVMNKIIIFGLLSIILVSLFPLRGTSKPKDLDILYYQKSHFKSYNGEPSLSSGEAYDAIKTIFDERYDEFNSQGYFPQIYESSLQATYFALYILDAVGKLDIINQTEIVNYIIAHYNENTHIFMDRYAERYLQTNFSNVNYFPTPSLLEVNCYAILSLDILGELGLLDVSEAINFIRNCYNPATSGFIGQPYSPSLQQHFKISTMDNTYFAILTLDTLGDDWSGHSSELNDMVYYIKSLQITDPNPFFGGFLNDEVDDFNSVDNLDITLLSSYYSLKSLDILNRIMTYTEFYDFLDKHYDNNVPYFEMSFVITPTNYSDIVGTALGLQLSDLSGYSGIDRIGVLNFLLNNRNLWEIWDASRYYPYHELTDTFQVIRALYETGELSTLSSNDKDQIVTSIENYYQQYDNGFSILSKDYTSLRLLQTIVKSAFNIYLQSEFGSLIQGIYDQIVSSYYYTSGNHFFAGCIDMFQQSPFYGGTLKSMNFHSRPLEFYSEVYDEHYNEIGLPYSHKTTYYALDVLYYIGMLDEFENECDLNDLVDNIIETQFLGASYTNYGGFVPNALLNNNLDGGGKNSHVFLEYTYYAIKSLEMLADYLQIGDITSFGFDKDALGVFLYEGQRGDGSTLYYDPWYSSDINTILRNTYYMVYILNLIEPTSLDALKINKIKNFVVQNIDYYNIKNLYYNYKICEILNLSIEFNFELTHLLVKDIYSSTNNQFSLTSNREYISDEVFLWICDMAKNDNMEINAAYPQSVELGNSINITVSLNNIVLDYFGDGISVKFESNQIGTFPLVRQPDKDYQSEVYISTQKENYPVVYGDIVVIEGFIEKERSSISIQTTSNLYESKTTSAEQDTNSEESSNGQIIEPSVQNALPIMITLIAVPSIIIFVSSKSRKKSKIATGFK